MDLRKKYKSETLAKTLEKASTMDANQLVKLMETTTKAIGVAVSAIEDEKQFNRFLVNRHEVYLFPELQEDGVTAIKEKSWTEEVVLKKLDTKALKDLTSVLKDLTALVREFTNVPTPAQAEAQRIAAERLELDKQKANVDKGPKEPITVIFGGDIDKYAK